MLQMFGGRGLDTDEILAALTAYFAIKPLNERDRVMEVLRYASRWFSGTVGCALIGHKQLEEEYEQYISTEGRGKGKLPTYVLECYVANIQSVPAES